ncbi:MAG: signal peptidase II [Candidatus Riflebacteria bacterium]|nr:signal peptidase II [Candidatus Riflebacteria bacterium]
MANLIYLAVDIVRWAAFWVMIMGCAALVWPFYVVRNFYRLMTGGGYFPLGVGLIVADQVVKLLAVLYLKHRTAQCSVIDGLLDLKYVENRGAAFGIFPGQTHMFIIMALLTVVIILLYLSIVDQEEPMVRVALVLILAGAVGNLIDRVYLGYVIDYIRVYYRDWEWPVFNLADSIIDIGVGLILIDFVLDLFGTHTEEAKGEASA